MKKQLDEYRPELESAISNVLESTSFINGPAVKTLAEDLSSFTGVKHSIPCASGADAGISRNTAFSYIEYNLFNYNRHLIAGTAKMEQV